MRFIKQNSFIFVTLMVIALSIITFHFILETPVYEGKSTPFLIPIFNFTVDAPFDLSDTWFTTHYIVNYFDYEFLKRGLVGSFYKLFNGTYSNEALCLLQLSFILLSVAITHYFFSKHQLNKKYIYLLFIISPATFMQFSYDFARFDCLLVSIFLLSVVFRHNLALFILFSTIGILTHELYIFTLLPASFLLFLSEKIDLTSLKEIFATSIASKVFYTLVLFILVVFAFGNYEPGFEQFKEVSLRSNPSITEFFNLWNRSILKDLSAIVSTMPYSVVILFIFVYSAIMIYFHLIGVKFKKPQYYLIILMSSPVFFIAWDWWRFLALIYISIFVVFVITERNKASVVSNKYMLLFSLYGPLTIAHLPKTPLIQLLAIPGVRIVKQYLFNLIH